MTRELSFAIIAAIAALALGAMWWGWWRRTKRDRGIVAPTDVPAGDVPERVFEGFYVATTRHGAPLDRLAIRHLAFRGRVTARVRTDGVVLEIPGEPRVFIRASALRDVSRATWTIDRVVERDGLVLLAWLVDGETVADTYLRFQDGNAADVVDAARPLLSTSTPTGSES